MVKFTIQNVPSSLELLAQIKNGPRSWKTKRSADYE